MVRLLTKFSTTPFAAIACCIALGIVCGRFVSSDVPFYIACLCLLIGVAAMLKPYLLKSEKRRVLAAYSLVNAIWAVVLPVMFIAGFLLLRSTQADEARITSAAYARGVVKERIVMANGEHLIVEVSALLSDMGLKSPVNTFDVMVYTGATDIEIGDDILFKANLNPVNQESSSAKYMYAKGIDFTSSTDVSKIRRLGVEPSLTAKARHCRDNIVLNIENSSLDQQSKAFAAALLLGDRDALTPEVWDDFAGAGIAHVLALSGLHIGIILLLLDWLTMPLNLYGSMREFRFILIGVGVVAFAVLTGLGASVVRATVMALCMLTAKLLHRKSARINALCLAACLIMLVSPRALFDVGFQLSFMSVLSIIGLMPAVTELLDLSLKRTLITLVTVPICVFVMTWPLVAWHFHSLPLMFLPLNLVLVPLLPFYMVLLVLFVAFLMAGVNLYLFAYLLDILNMLMAKSAQWIAHIPAANADIFPHWTIAVLGIVTLFTIVYYIKCSSARTFIVALSSVLSLCVCAAVIPSDIPPDTLRIPSNYRAMQITYQESGRENTCYLTDGGYSRLRLTRGTILYADAPLDRLDPEEELTADMLIVGQNFHGDADSLLARSHPKLVVISPRVYDNTQRKIEAGAAKHRLPLHRLADLPLQITY